MIATAKAARSYLRVPKCVALVFSIALVTACEHTTEPELVASAKFGIFFGGQIEERRDIPFDLDTSKQTQGFRIQFANRLPRSVDVTWAIEMPGAAAPAKTARRKGADAPEPHRKSISGKATVPAGQSSFEQATPFEPGDPLGLWNARVVVGGKVVVDRPFEVYDSAERARAASADAGAR